MILKQLPVFTDALPWHVFSSATLHSLLHLFLMFYMGWDRYPPGWRMPQQRRDLPLPSPTYFPRRTRIVWFAFIVCLLTWLYICTQTTFLGSYAYIQQDADRITDVTTPEQAQHVIDNNAFAFASPNKQSTNLTSPKIGKITMLYGPPNPTYERALQSHLHHSTVHFHPTFILRQQLLSRLWSKPAYILSRLLLELENPDPTTRLDWLFWFDADTYLLNPHVPLSIFLPSEDHSHVHLLCTNDHNGLNDGVFFARVDPWTVHLMAAALSLEELLPTVSLKYSEQSAIEHLITQEPFYANHTAIVPQRWFNAFMGPRDWNGEIKKGKQLEGNGVREGDLLVHFAGRGDTKRARMTRFMDAVEKDRGNWEVVVGETEIEEEVREFWEGWAANGVGDSE